jgi:hypothetical protein
MHASACSASTDLPHPEELRETLKPLSPVRGETATALAPQSEAVWAWVTERLAQAPRPAAPFSRPFFTVFRQRVRCRINGLADRNGDLQKNGENGEKRQKRS